MVKIFDKLLLFVFSVVAAIGAVALILYGSDFIPAQYWPDQDAVADSLALRITLIAIGIVLLLISVRFLYLSMRAGRATAPSIDQRTDFGDIRISLETVENLSLKSAARIKGVQDLKARVHVTQAGLEIVIRAVVDGESSIPELTEEMQRSVKSHLEEITGIPVASVSVFVANIIQSVAFRSRVE